MSTHKRSQNLKQEDQTVLMERALANLLAKKEVHALQALKSFTTNMVSYVPKTVPVKRSAAKSWNLMLILSNNHKRLRRLLHKLLKQKWKVQLQLHQLMTLWILKRQLALISLRGEYNKAKKSTVEDCKKN